MVFISIVDFYEKASQCNTLTRNDEVKYARKMKDGDMSAREVLIQSYIPMVAGHIKRLQPHLQQFGLVLYCMQALESEIDKFDFFQDGESFAHRLSWGLRQAVTKYVVK